MRSRYSVRNRCVASFPHITTVSLSIRRTQRPQVIRTLPLLSVVMHLENKPSELRLQQQLRVHELQRCVINGFQRDVALSS